MCDKTPAMLYTENGRLQVPEFTIYLCLSLKHWIPRGTLANAAVTSAHWERPHFFFPTYTNFLVKFSWRVPSVNLRALNIDRIFSEFCHFDNLRPVRASILFLYSRVNLFYSFVQGLPVWMSLGQATGPVGNQLILNKIKNSHSNLAHGRREHESPGFLLQTRPLTIL